MTKSLAKRLHKKTCIYTFKISHWTPIGERLDEFNKIIIDLANIEIKFEEEDQIIMLLTSLDLSYLNTKETMMYGKETLMLNEIQYVLHARKLQNKVETIQKQCGV